MLSSDGRSGYTVDRWDDVVTVAGASIQPISEEWRMEYAKLGRDTSHVMYCDTLQGSLNVVELLTNEDDVYRIVLDREESVSYFEVNHAKDVAERRRMAHCLLMERDEGWKSG